MREAVPAFLAFGILIAVVVAGTGPWSHLGGYTFVAPKVGAISSLSHKPVSVTWKFAPAIAGTWILISLVVVLAALQVGAADCPVGCLRVLSAATPQTSRRSAFGKVTGLCVSMSRPSWLAPQCRR